MRKARFSLLIIVVWGLFAALVFAPPLDWGAVSPLEQLQNAERALTFEGALAFAVRMDGYADRLPALPMARSGTAINALAVEIVPYYYYEGIADRTTIPPVWYALFADERHFHYSGVYFGLTKEVNINFRYGNPWASRWYTAPRLLATLIHELGHAQGILGWTDDVEPATQVATLEVLASMVRDGNIYALPEFIRVAAEYAEDYAYSLALQNDRMVEFGDYIERVADTEYQVAAYYRSRDHWADQQERLMDILQRYGERPYILVVGALSDPELKTEVLPSVPNGEHKIRLNDTAWVLDHLDALLRDYDDLLRDYREAGGVP